MFKKITILIAALAVSAGTLFAETTNVAVIDMNQVMQSFSKTPAVLKSLEADYALAASNEKEAVAQFQKKQEELKKLVEAAESTLNSAEAKEKARQQAIELNKQIIKERQEFIDANNQIKQSLEKKRVERLNDLLKDITPVISEYAKANKIDVIVNTANGVIFASEKANITKAIIAELAKKFPAPATADTPKTETAPAKTN